MGEIEQGRKIKSGITVGMVGIVTAVFRREQIYLPKDIENRELHRAGNI